jgi:outer membrane protein, heavy metal efflux system
MRARIATTVRETIDMPISSGADRAARARKRLASTALAALLTLPSIAQAQPLPLSELLARAAAQDPNRPAAEARVQAAEAAARQAAVKPNPSLGLDVENFAGTGDRQLFDQTESTLYYQQTYERGGKREARTSAARAEIAVERLRSEVRTLDHLATVQVLWVEAAAAEAQVGVAEERLATTQRLERETARRVAAARDPLFAGERARTAVAEAGVALDRARQTVANARAALGAYVGLPSVEIDLAVFNSLSAGPASGAAGVETADLQVLEAQRDAALARVRVEESRAVHDPTFRAGVRHFREGGDVAFIVGGSIPLGRNDTNRGNIERARAERLAAEADIAAVRAERGREIGRLNARRQTTAVEIGRLDSQVLPSARRAVSLVIEGFNRGGGAFTVLEVTDAQRAVTDARARRVDLLKSFHLDGVRLDRLTGRHAVLIARAETR